MWVKACLFWKFETFFDKIEFYHKGSTADFDPSRLCVDIMLFYGSNKLKQKQTTAIPLVKDITTSLKDTKKYELSILNDKLVFEVSEIDQDSSGKKEIYAIIYVKYNNVCKCLKFLMWNLDVKIKKINLKSIHRILFGFF